MASKGGNDTQGGSLMHPHACIDAKKKIIAKDRAKNDWVCEGNVELSPEKLRGELQKSRLQSLRFIPALRGLLSLMPGI